MGRGQLAFKGDDPPKNKSKKKVKHSTSRPDDVSTTTTEAAAAAAAASQSSLLSSTSASIQQTVVASKTISQQQQQQQQQQPPPPPQIRDGTGTITVSGTVVTGYDTIFNTELNVGDAIIISVPSSSNTTKVHTTNTNTSNATTTEMRVITMRLSNISLNISSPFSTNIKYPITFQYIPKPKNLLKEIATSQAKQYQLQHDIQRHAFDTYTSPPSTTNTVASNNTTTNNNDGTAEVIYRERTEHGSYRIKSMKYPTSSSSTAASSTQLSRSELLELRSKKTSDKYC